MKITDVKQTANITDETIESIQETIKFLEYATDKNKFKDDMEGIIDIPSVNDISDLTEKLNICFKVLSMNKTEYIKQAKKARG
tara:strand:- start:2197 stop:2445 length:249 start_codon:yes stop_codon:yes gene_type:complete